jgi:hypothetical protein
MAIYAPVAAEGRKTTVKTLIQKERGAAATIQPLYIYTAREKEGMRGREGAYLYVIRILKHIIESVCSAIISSAAWDDHGTQ